VELLLKKRFQMSQPIPANAPDPYRLILASSSPRRRELLASLGLPFSVVAPDDGETEGPGIDETPRPGEPPPDLVKRLSRTKALAVAAHLPARPGSPANHPNRPRVVIIAADTVVVLAGEILGKPADPAQARHMLKRLRRRRIHHVYTGLTVGSWEAGENGEIVRPAGGSARPVSNSQLITRLTHSQVWMRPYTDAQIEAYVASGDPLDKAGAYGIQHQSFAPVERLTGCFANVMGLPLAELAGVLAELGVALPAVAPGCTGCTGRPCCQPPSNL
jgi:septum formation protein